MEIKIVHISVPLCLLLAALSFQAGRWLGGYEVREEARRAGAVTRIFDQDRWILRWNTGNGGTSNMTAIVQRKSIIAPNSPVQPQEGLLQPDTPVNSIKLPFQ